MMDGGLFAVLLKAASAFGGTILSLVFQPPKTIRDWVTRTTFSFGSGFMFGDPVREQWLHWPETTQYVVAAAALTAMVSWSAWGAIVKTVLSVIRQYRPEEEEKRTREGED